MNMQRIKYPNKKMAFVLYSLFQFSIAASASQLSSIEFSVDGYCKTNGGKSYEMELVRHINNESIQTRVGSAEFILSLELDNLKAVELGNPDEEWIANIADFLHTDYRPDVVISFAELDHEDFVYWRESYVHRTYRQGLFKFNGKTIVPVCTGVGGVTYRR